MINKRGGSYRILLCLLGLSFIVFSGAFAENSRFVNIRVDTRVALNKYFYGFGVETLPWLWTKENREAGVDEQDIRLNFERIEGMRLPLTRIFVPWETWNPGIDYKTFTWDSDEMRSLYKTLNFYQKTGTRVILVNVDWLEESPWKNIEGSTRAVLKLLEYLIKEKGYNCIQFWTLTNEPELTYGWLKKVPFENYVQIHRLVKRGLKERGLAVKIIASDEVESREWFSESVRSLYVTADSFSSHAYFSPRDMRLISDYFTDRLGIIKRASFAKRDIPFFLCEFGFRGYDFGPRTNSLIENYEYGIYTAYLCIEALNSGVAAASLWCLHHIRLIDEINPGGGKMMNIGLWAYKDRNWQPFPVFYLYRLFTRYVKSGSRVLKTSVSPVGMLKAACTEYENKYSLFIVNASDIEQKFLIEWKNADLDFKRYVYSKSGFSAPHKNLVMTEDRLKVKGYLKDVIAPQSVILYTNLEDGL